jgi:hypothetical protein
VIETQNAAGKPAAFLFSVMPALKRRASRLEAGERDLHLATAAQIHEVLAHARLHFRHRRVFPNAKTANVGLARGAESRRYFRRHLKLFSGHLIGCTEQRTSDHDHFNAHVINPAFCFLFSGSGRPCEHGSKKAKAQQGDS